MKKFSLSQGVDAMIYAMNVNEIYENFLLKDKNQLIDMCLDKLSFELLTLPYSISTSSDLVNTELKKRIINKDIIFDHVNTLIINIYNNEKHEYHSIVKAIISEDLNEQSRRILISEYNKKHGENKHLDHINKVDFINILCSDLEKPNDFIELNTNELLATIENNIKNNNNADIFKIKSSVFKKTNDFFKKVDGEYIPIPRFTESEKAFANAYESGKTFSFYDCDSFFFIEIKEASIKEIALNALVNNRFVRDFILTGITTYNGIILYTTGLPESDYEINNDYDDYFNANIIKAFNLYGYDANYMPLSARHVKKRMH